MTGKVLLTGATGYVGGVLRASLAARHDLTCLGLSRGAGPDLRDREAVLALAERPAFETIIHAAGTTDLAACEASPRHAWEANVLPVAHLAEAFPGARLILVSTDHVFPGDRGGYREGDTPNPCNAYGRSKLAAETAGMLFARRFIALRLSALYDRDAAFLRFLEGELSAGRPVEAFTDAYYSPCWHGDFTALVARLLGPGAPDQGVFHACGPRLSRWEFARLFAHARGFDPELVRPAPRGAGSRMMADLSLDCPETCARLGHRVTPHAEALGRLAAGA